LEDKPYVAAHLADTPSYTLNQQNHPYQRVCNLQRDTEDEPYVAADLAQSQRELDSWEEQVPSNQRLWAMFEAEEMERYNEFLHQRIIKYPLTFGALSEDHWFNPLTGQPNIAAMQGALGVLESDLPQVMKAMQDDGKGCCFEVQLWQAERRHMFAQPRALS
jgi:hypothetical protein